MVQKQVKIFSPEGIKKKAKNLTPYAQLPSYAPVHGQFKAGIKTYPVIGK